MLRLKAPDPEEEQDELWAASTELGEITKDEKDKEIESLPIPKPEQYKDWFYILIKWISENTCEIEIVMIEAALEKTDGMVSQASDALKLEEPH